MHIDINYIRFKIVTWLIALGRRHCSHRCRVREKSPCYPFILISCFFNVKDDSNYYYYRIVLRISRAPSKVLSYFWPLHNMSLSLVVFSPDNSLFSCQYVAIHSFFPPKKCLYLSFRSDSKKPRFVLFWPIFKIKRQKYSKEKRRLSILVGWIDII